jgi:hypothetical protein
MAMLAIFAPWPGSSRVVDVALAVSVAVVALSG